MLTFHKNIYKTIYKNKDKNLYKNIYKNKDKLERKRKKNDDMKIKICLLEMLKLKNQLFLPNKTFIHRLKFNKI